MKPKEYPEHFAQKAVFEWAALSKKDYPELEMMFAIPNGFKAGKAAARWMKDEGLKPGVPDIFLPIRNGWGGELGLFIEMKIKPNKSTEVQLWWHKRLTDRGYKVVVCYSSEDAIREIKGYLR